MTDPASPQTYAISLLFDAAFSQAVHALSDDLARVTKNDVLIQKNAPVHLTLGMFHVQDAQIPTLKSLFYRFAPSVEPFSLTFSGTDSFKGKVIFLSPDPHSESFVRLKNLNERLHQILLSHFSPGANRNYLPDRFFPHIALAVKLTKPQFEAGINWAHPPTSGGRVFRPSLTLIADKRQLRGSIPLRMKARKEGRYHSLLCAEVTAVSLARCHPYEEIERQFL